MVFKHTQKTGQVEHVCLKVFVKHNPPKWWLFSWWWIPWDRIRKKNHPEQIQGFVSPLLGWCIDINRKKGPWTWQTLSTPLTYIRSLKRWKKLLTTTHPIPNFRRSSKPYHVFAGINQYKIPIGSQLKNINIKTKTYIHTHKTNVYSKS